MHHDATAAAAAARLACRPLPGPDRVCWAVAAARFVRDSWQRGRPRVPGALLYVQAGVFGSDPSVSMCHTGKWVYAAVSDLVDLII